MKSTLKILFAILFTAQALLSLELIEKQNNSIDLDTALACKDCNK